MCDVAGNLIMVFLKQTYLVEKSNVCREQIDCLRNKVILSPVAVNTVEEAISAALRRGLLISFTVPVRSLVRVYVRIRRRAYDGPLRHPAKLWAPVVGDAGAGRLSVAERQAGGQVDSGGCEAGDWRADPTVGEFSVLAAGR